MMRSESTKAFGQPSETKLIFRAGCGSGGIFGAIVSVMAMFADIGGYRLRCEHYDIGYNSAVFSREAISASEFAIKNDQDPILVVVAASHLIPYVTVFATACGAPRRPQPPARSSRSGSSPPSRQSPRDLPLAADARRHVDARLSAALRLN